MPDADYPLVRASVVYDVMLTPAENDRYWDDATQKWRDIEGYEIGRSEPLIEVVTPVVTPSTGTPLPPDSNTAGQPDSNTAGQPDSNTAGQPKMFPAMGNWPRWAPREVRDGFDAILSPLIYGLDAVDYNKMLDALVRVVLEARHE